MKVYVVTEPESIRGIYDTWPECRAAVSGVAGARYQAVSSRALAEAMLRGEPVVLPPGHHAFVDGNAMGGVGVVLVDQGDDGKPRAVQELGTTVYEVFGGAGVPSLDARPKITAAVNRLHNVIAELAALYKALELAPAGASLTVVHDYEGVGAWLEGRWKARDPVVADVVAACRQRIADRRLNLAFRHQRGHESTPGGRHDFGPFHAPTDKRAPQATLPGRWGDQPPVPGPATA